VLQPTLGQVVTDLDLPAIRDLIDELSQSGFDDVVHLASFGGWNGPHLDPNLSADESYSVWRRHVGGFFHGIDWDLEGNDHLESVNNYFTLECLDKMGEISRMAKEDDFFVSMAPPQPYLDVHGTGRFRRYVNLTDPHRQWHSEFQYFGTNVYAYLLAKYDQCIDLISVQLYESYSRAAQAVRSQGIEAGKYLEQ
jgi:chitinase